MAFGTKVGLWPGNIVLDADPGTAPRLLSAHVYCGHGRPSQLLLSSCNVYVLVRSRTVYAGTNI